MPIRFLLIFVDFSTVFHDFHDSVSGGHVRGSPQLADAASREAGRAVRTLQTGMIEANGEEREITSSGGISSLLARIFNSD